MLGFRGCRLSVVYPEITEMQAKAVAAGAAMCKKVRATLKKGLAELTELAELKKPVPLYTP